MEENTFRKEFWKNYGPAAILLIIIAALLSWAFLSGKPDVEVLPPLTIIRVLLLILVGILAGWLGGLIGTGGCAIILPIIAFWMGFPAPLAIGTTLFVVIFTAISGGYGHWVRNNVHLRSSIWLGSAGVIGVLLGSFLFSKIVTQAALLSFILGIVFIWPSIRMIYEGIFPERLTAERDKDLDNASELSLASFGMGVGTLTGLIGLGGGYLLVPGLIYLFGAPVYLTMGTSLTAVIAIAIVGGGIKLFQGYVAFKAALFIAAGTIIGAQVGAATITRFKPATLKLIFGIYFLYAAVKFILSYLGITIW